MSNPMNMKNLRALNSPIKVKHIYQGQMKGEWKQSSIQNMNIMRRSLCQEGEEQPKSSSVPLLRKS